jgi:hypothetical protein
MEWIENKTARYKKSGQWLITHQRKLFLTDVGNEGTKGSEEKKART